MVLTNVLPENLKHIYIKSLFYKIWKRDKGKSEVVYALFSTKNSLYQSHFKFRIVTSIFVHLRACHSTNSGRQDHWKPLLNILNIFPLN